MTFRFAQAQMFAATSKGRALLRRKPSELPWWFDIRAAHRTFAKYAPTLWQEITGIADGLGISTEHAALCFGNDGLRPLICGRRLGCLWPKL